MERGEFVERSISGGANRLILKYRLLMSELSISVYSGKEVIRRFLRLASAGTKKYAFPDKKLKTQLQNLKTWPQGSPVLFVTRSLVTG